MSKITDEAVEVAFGVAFPRSNISRETLRAALSALHEAGFVVVPAERVRDLTDCLSDMTKHYVELAGSGDCGFWNPEEEQEVIAARRMIQAARAGK